MAIKLLARIKALDVEEVEEADEVEEEILMAEALILMAMNEAHQAIPITKVKEISIRTEEEDVFFKEEEDMALLECYYCNKHGHKIRECRFKKADDEKQYGAGYMHQTNSGDGDYKETLLLACHGDQMNDVWYLDSGASKHMTSNKNLFFLPSISSIVVK